MTYHLLNCATCEVYINTIWVCTGCVLGVVSRTGRFSYGSSALNDASVNSVKSAMYGGSFNHGAYIECMLGGSFDDFS